MRRNHDGIVLACLLLAACSGNPDQPAARAASEEALPRPGAVHGSVTGMPEPGMAAPAAADAMPAEAEGAPTSLQPGIDPAPVASAQPPTADDAVALLRDYYAALNARDYARALALWEAPPQSLQEFAGGFASTSGLSVQIGQPVGPATGAGGDVEVPVVIDMTLDDGRIERYTGAYLLRATGSAGDGPGWRISDSRLSIR